MKTILTFLVSASFFLILQLPTVAFSAVCPSTCPTGTNWTTSWSDSVFSGGSPTAHTETTYTITAPCHVFFDTDFLITISVDDNETFNPSSRMVAFNWSLTDEPLTSGGISTLLSGFWLDLEQDTTASGFYDHWERTYTQRYITTVEDHDIHFNFTDLGSRGGFHGTSSQVLGCVTVDPIKPGPVNNAPIASAGLDIYLASDAQIGTVLAGTATDSDGDALLYRWLEGGIVVQGFAPVDVLGNAPLDLGTVLPLSIGSHNFTLEVTDNIDTVTDTAIVTVENSAPVAVPSGAGVYQLFNDLSLNGSVSDFDGDLLTYSWTDGATLLASGTILTVAGGAPVALPTHMVGGLSLGLHTVVLSVTDGINTYSSSIIVEFVDSEAPSLAPVATPNMLWPPDHKFIDVFITTNATDNSGAQPSLMVSLTSNAKKKEKKSSEAHSSVVGIDQSTGVIHLSLKADRTDDDDALKYNVRITATDPSGNSSTATVVISVPHDHGKDKKHGSKDHGSKNHK